MREDPNRSELGLNSFDVHRTPEAILDLVREKQLNRMLMASLEPGGPALELLKVEPDEGEPGAGQPARAGLQGWTKVAADEAGTADDDSCRRSAAVRRACIGVAGATDTKRLGLNQLKAYRRYWDDDAGAVRVSSKYGRHGESLRDAGRLGAKVVRQVGGRDLLWGFLLAHDGVEITSAEALRTGRPIPVFGSDPTTSAELRWGVRAPQLGELLGVAEDVGLELHFTFLLNTAGDDGGGAGLPGMGAGSSAGCSGEGRTFYHRVGGSRLATNVVEMDWDEDHVAEQDHETPPNSFPIERSSYGSLCEWHLDTLDVSAPYKRSYVQYLGEAAGALLQRAAQLDPRIDLGTLVSAIGIFNEVSVADQYHEAGEYDPEVTGEMWGRACARGAYGIRQAVAATEVKLSLPGLLSYSWSAESGGPQSWQTRLRYLRSLVYGFAREMMEVLPVGSREPTSLPDYLQAIDLHWYHHQREDTCHVGFMVHEVNDVFAYVEDGLREGLNEAVDRRILESRQVDEIASSVMDRFEVRVSETGCSADPRGTTKLPETYFPVREDFQAFEVWRRLGGALASRASGGSWHSWMAGNSGTYRGFGLRRDTGPENAPASAATPRKSWFAYQRLTEQLGEVASGGMVFPDSPSRSTLQRDLHSSAAPGVVDPLVIFEYRLGSGTWPWAYLVLADPLAANTVSPVTMVVPRWVAGYIGTAVRVPIQPSSTRIGIPTMGSDELPVGVASYDSSWSFRLGSPLFVHTGDMPVLIKSSGRIRWTRPGSGALEEPVAGHREIEPDLRGSGAGDRVAELEARRHLGPDRDLLRELWTDLPRWLEDPSVPLFTR
jgi:hypothetical protein